VEIGGWLFKVRLTSSRESPVRLNDTVEPVRASLSSWGGCGRWGWGGGWGIRCLRGLFKKKKKKKRS